MNALSNLVEAVVERPETEGRTLALLAMKDGATEIEWYGLSPTTFFGGGERVTETTTLISWSMAKSITHALLGIAMVDGLLDVNDPAPFAPLQAEGQPPMRWIDLLEMRSGLTFVEDYEDASVSHCLEMLFSGEEHRGVADMGMYAATLGREFRPGEHWSYASGTTNILCRMLGDILAGGDVASVGAEKRKNAIEQFAKERLFGPIGTSSPIMKFDATGTFVGSSFVYATARDFATFGELYRRGARSPMALRFFPRAGTIMHVIGWRMTQRARGRTVSTMAGTGGCGLISKAHLLPRASKVNTYLCSLRPESRWFTSESPTRRWRHPWWHALVTSCESCDKRRESELVSQLKCFDEM